MSSVLDNGSILALGVVTVVAAAATLASRGSSRFGSRATMQIGPQDVARLAGRHDRVRNLAEAEGELSPQDLAFLREDPRERAKRRDARTMKRERAWKQSVAQAGGDLKRARAIFAGKGYRIL